MPASTSANPKRVTIREVARLAGVSTATVSKVLNKAKSQVAISPDTVERVERVCREAGYRPNRSAQSLRSGRSHLIGISMSVSHGPDLDLDKFSDYRWCNDDQVPRELRRFDGDELQAYCGHAAALGSMFDAFLSSREVYEGWDMVLHHRNESQAEPFTDADLEADLFDGLIYTNPTASHREFIDLARRGFPVVVDGQVDDPTIATVGTDNEAGGRIAAEHLASLGRRSLFCFWPYSPDLQASASRSRGARAGWQRAAGKGARYSERFSGAILNINKGYEVVRAALEADPSIDAVIAGHGPMGMGAVYGVESLGRRVPDDVAVVTIGDGVENLLFSPTISAVEVPFRRVYGEAIEKLMTLIRGGKPDPIQTAIVPRLAIRESSGG